MKSKIVLAVVALVFASGTAYAAMQGMSCCANCECCDDEHDGMAREKAAPAPKQ